MLPSERSKRPRRWAAQAPVNLFYERVGPESTWPHPRFETCTSVFDKVAAFHQFIPFQRSQTFWNDGQGR